MDLQETIRQLQLQLERIDAVIASLEELQADTEGVVVSVKKRRGRKSMSLEERREVSARMKKYWAKRRQRQAG